MTCRQTQGKRQAWRAPSSPSGGRGPEERAGAGWVCGLGGCVVGDLTPHSFSASPVRISGGCPGFPPSLGRPGRALALPAPTGQCLPDTPQAALCFTPIPPAGHGLRKASWKGELGWHLVTPQATQMHLYRAPTSPASTPDFHSFLSGLSVCCLLFLESKFLILGPSEHTRSRVLAQTIAADNLLNE